MVNPARPVHPSVASLHRRTLHCVSTAPCKTPLALSLGRSGLAPIAWSPRARCVQPFRKRAAVLSCACASHLVTAFEPTARPFVDHHLVPFSSLPTQRTNAGLTRSADIARTDARNLLDLLRAPKRGQGVSEGADRANVSRREEGETSGWEERERTTGVIWDAIAAVSRWPNSVAEQQRA